MAHARPGFRDKTLPAGGHGCHIREKTLPACVKQAKMSVLRRAGRVLSRSYVRCVDQGEFCPAENLWCELAAVPVGGGPTGGRCVVCGDCGCGAGGHGRPTGGWCEACWGMWLRCRWAAAGPGRASRSIIPSRKARVWRSRGRAAAHRRIEQPQKARRVLAPHGDLTGARSCSRDRLLRGPVLLSSHPQLVLL